MKYKETAAKRKDRVNSTICECGHCQAWHYGKVVHLGPCSYPSCKCNSFRTPR